MKEPQHLYCGSFFALTKSKTDAMKLGLNTISIWFGMIMILLVVAGAFAFAFTNFMDDKLYGPKRIFFVILLLAYAVYRVYRLRQLLKQNNNE